MTSHSDHLEDSMEIDETEAQPTTASKGKSAQTEADIKAEESAELKTKLQGYLGLCRQWSDQTADEEGNRVSKNDINAFVTDHLSNGWWELGDYTRLMKLLPTTSNLNLDGVSSTIDLLAQLERTTRKTLLFETMQAMLGREAFEERDNMRKARCEELKSIGLDEDSVRDILDEDLPQGKEADSTLEQLTQEANLYASVLEEVVGPFSIDLEYAADILGCVSTADDLWDDLTLSAVDQDELRQLEARKSFVKNLEGSTHRPQGLDFTQEDESQLQRLVLRRAVLDAFVKQEEGLEE